MRAMHAIFALALLAGLGVAGDREAKAQGGPRVVAQTGTNVQGVQWRTNRTASWEAAKPNAPLIAGASLQTAELSLEVRLSDGSSLVLGPSTIVQFQDPMDVDIDRGASTRASRVDIKQGAIDARIVKGVGKALLVVAPNDIFAAFRPGRARARLNADGLLAVVEEGSARVASKGQWASLNQGEYVLLRDRGKPEAPKTLPPAPNMSGQLCIGGGETACGVVLALNGKAPIGAHWAPGAGVKHYQVLIARDPSMIDVISRQQVPGDQAGFQSEALEPGMYYVTVQSFGMDGMDGGSVGPRAMRVIGASLDPGVVYLPKSSILVLPLGRGLTISQSAGLEMASASPDFVAAASRFYLLDDEQQRDVKLRIAGDTTSLLAFTLERRSLVADVDMAPRTARWPQDPVRITVRLSDRKARIAVDSFEPVIKVSVNNQPVFPQFTREGAKLTAQIAPRPGSGPWVVRIEILDKEGNSIGRDFLEVAGSHDQSRRGGW